MKAVSDTLMVSRSNLAKRARGSKPRGKYLKAADAWLLPLVRRICDGRPTFGYRRVGALLNQELAAQARPPVNHKRVYRVMRQNGLLLARHTGQGRQLPHQGKVITLKPNQRWCSDTFEIPCWNGDSVRVAFALDTCDREAIAWVATTAGISGEMVRDMMVQAVEYRFGPVEKVPRPLEWLTDHGSCYTASDTVDFAHGLGLVPCFTPVRSPESNGMAESFVKSFKRDYVFVNQRPDAASVLIQIAGWFQDYNEVRPHKGLRLLSPRQFIRSNLQTAECPL
jgi:putative transposase